MTDNPCNPNDPVANDFCNVSIYPFRSWVNYKANKKNNKAVF